MSKNDSLERFVDAQRPIFATALSELAAGLKKTHWMWFIFPQVKGLGQSATSDFYAIASLVEAANYLRHPLLGSRLRQCVDVLISWEGLRTAEQIFGPTDALKLRSCLTLFEILETDDRFGRALEAFFNGSRDERTLALLNACA